MTGRVVTFGELLLRLTPPGFERLLQNPQLAATFGGAEANVAVALAAFGMETAYVTVLPENHPVADAGIAELRRFGVDTSRVARGNGRLGIYYQESGANQRPSRVVYDREHSAIALAKPGDIEWEKVFDGAGWFHVTGITPALSASAADLTTEAMQKARAMGLTVSFDLNYRSTLWNWGKSAPEVLGSMIAAADVLIANEEHLRFVLGLTEPISIGELIEKGLTLHSNIKAAAVSRRESRNAFEHSCSAWLGNRKELLAGRPFDITHAIDRIGAGDAFAAGL